MRFLRPALALLFLLAFLACTLHEHRAEANVSLYGVGEYSLYSVLVNLGSSYTYHRDTVTAAYAGTDNFQIVIYALQVAYSNFAALDSLADASYVDSSLLQVPLYGSGLIHTYNLPNISLASPLIFDGETLGRIWTGNITHWDDPAILGLNPFDDGTVLPHKPIVLCYGSSDNETITQTFKRGMRALSPLFAEQLDLADDFFSGLPPFDQDRAFFATNSTTRIRFVRNTPYSLTYSDMATATAQRVLMASMINKAGARVLPSVDSIQSAMEDFQEALQNGGLLIPIFNGQGQGSWPLSYVATVVVSAVGDSADCAITQELVQFLSWLQINQRAVDRAAAQGWVPLSVAYKKKVIDLLGTIECDGELALTTAYVIGEGISRPALVDLASNYDSNAFTQKYFASDVPTVVRDIAQGAIDFAAVTTGATLEQVHVEGVAIIPVLGYAAFPCYNIPELRFATAPLNLTLELWAAIYMNEVKVWNDARIVAINPQFAGLLTNRSITVVVGTNPSLLTRAVTTALSSASASFNSTVGVVDLPDYPVQSVANRTVLVGGAESAIASRLNTVTYALSALSSGTIATTKSVRMAALLNSAGNYVLASTDTVQSAMLDFTDTSDQHLFQGALYGSGDRSYPLTLYDSFMVPTRSTDCTKAAAVVDWIWWTQSSDTARRTASRNGIAQAATVPGLSQRILLALANVTCNGEQVSSIANCVSAEGTLCSDRGVCYQKRCECAEGWTGDHCQTNASTLKTTSSDDTIMVATLASIIPAAALVVLLIVVVAIVLVVMAKRRQTRDEWEIDTDELEMGETLGTGGYGEVFRAKWRGTEVAVKMMVARDGLITKDMQRNFAEEVRVMTALRHPNVVLFMAASTKPPKLCIVMEFMGLGSLYELLHNELVPELPNALKVKMAYQAAKGMHFLHSSGIVHRDLKSLNLLLDSKWNLKVSDFGLTKFREEMKQMGQSAAMQGSIHWTAPEVLNENPDVDLVLADVYSFGIILWELVTREQPFAGMSPAAVAVAVIRDNLRPSLPDYEDEDLSPEYRELLVSCWHPDPTIRPTFLEIMTRLSSMVGDSSSNNSFTSKSSSSSSGPSIAKAAGDGSWTLPSGSSASNSSSGSDRSRDQSAKWLAAHEGAGGGGVRAPEGEVTIVFSDITRAASLWEFNPAAMKDATLMHNDALRALLKQHGGYEVVFIRDRNSGEGSFCLAFQRTEDALNWCMESQRALVELDWPQGLLEHPGAAEEWGDTDDRVLYRGPRVRMGVHVGIPKVVRDPMTRRVEFIGPVVNTAARITALTHGGQILLSHHAAQRVQSSELAQEKNRLICLGKFEMLESDQEGAKLYELKARGLEARFFGGVSKENDFNSLKGPRRHDKLARELSGASVASSSSSAADGGSDSSGVALTAVGEGMMFQEDNFLTSANLCRWVLDYNEIAMGKQIGMGSYGVVYGGKWKGIEVAVKRFIKQKLDERRMLEFRAEMAFLSELHHPNIVLFIGACVKRPNLCIVTEFVKQGSLKDILATNAIKLPWQQKLRLLRSAALGINYLHSLQPVIVHRDLKPSNLLVDENWNVKVADFGFARIKEENVTMTRCGTPCWTAPEVIRGEKYSEKADVFSFGVIMWEVLTRKQPFAGRNFMSVSLDVLEGRRPQIPPDTPQNFKKMVKRCWHMEADKRPAVEEVIALLDALIDNTSDLTMV